MILSIIALHWISGSDTDSKVDVDVVDIHFCRVKDKFRKNQSKTQDHAKEQPEWAIQSLQIRKVTTHRRRPDSKTQPAELSSAKIT